MSASSSPLAQVLQRADVWRGRLAQVSVEGEPSGFDVLDAELPGGGWPRGALTELLVSQQGVGELSLLLPALARLSQTGWVALIAPSHLPHAAAWAGAGIALEHLWLVRANDAMDAAWATEQVLASGAFAAVLSWLPKANAYALRRLQLAAEGQRSLAFVMRPTHAASSSSPAPLRLTLEAGQADDVGYLIARLIKRRGPLQHQPLRLMVKRPLPLARLNKKRITHLSLSRRQPTMTDVLLK
ncbi:MAG TPA: translesion DNA synthesis-associated protein ImuA [Rhodocyclaceae bacterium]|nr:translesion DNA synthesis-associated protein ImuA [Rhodocyclaceae bacterium]